MILDFIPPKPTNNLVSSKGRIDYAIEPGRIYLCKIRQTEKFGQKEVLTMLKTESTKLNLPIQAIAINDKRVKFFINNGFQSVSRSNELGYTVMVWTPKTALPAA